MSRALKSIVVIVFVAMLASPLFAEAARGTYIITADVPLRGGPGADQEVITVLPRGIQVNVVGKEGYWLRIESKHGGRPGYIDEQFARPTTPQASTAPARDYGVSVAGPYRTLREVALREGPGTKYPVVARIPFDVRVNITRAEGDWLRVESSRGGKPGYVDKGDVERLPER